MMIGVSMRVTRVDYPNGAYELRDSLDQRWQRFLRKALPDKVVIPIPNLAENTLAYITNLPFTGFILTGGEDWGEFPERDQTEKAIFAYADKCALPAIGVCRGAQLMNLLCGGRLAAGHGESHAATRHELRIREQLQHICGNIARVNSYHDNVIPPNDLAQGLEIWAQGMDGSVEAFCGGNGLFCGIMWHPEREPRPCEHDMSLFRHFFGGGGI